MNSMGVPLRPCPRCGQGAVQHMLVRANRKHVFVCDECEATWFDAEKIAFPGHVDLGIYLRSLGLLPLWSELAPIELEPSVRTRRPVP
jgi:hypothetical protein